MKYAPTFTHTDTKIGADHAQKLYAFFKSQLAVGMELETSFTKDVGQQVLEKDLKAQRNYGYLNEYGIDRCYQDGSIRGAGASEVVTVGNSSAYRDYHERLAKTERVIMSHDSNNNESCSMHTSILLLQNVRVPAVVVKNFYQVWRRWADCFLWLASATSYDTPAGVKNWYIRPRGVGNFAKIDEVMANSGVTSSLAQIKERQTKYTGLNFSKLLLTTDKKDCGLFFIECRTPDRHQVAHASTSYAFLLKAAVLKSVRLAEHGLLTYSNEEFAKTKRLVEMLKTGTPLTVEEKQEIGARCAELFSFLKPEILAFEPFVLKVLAELAVKPVSVRYREMTKNKPSRWRDEKIEAEFDALYKQHVAPVENAGDLRAVIEQSKVEAENATAWKDQAASLLGIAPRTVEYKLEQLGRAGSVVWDADARGYLYVI